MSLLIKCEHRKLYEKESHTKIKKELNLIFFVFPKVLFKLCKVEKQVNTAFTSMKNLKIIF